VSLPRILFIVDRQKLDVYEQLRRSFDDEPSVQVVLDRRHAERRRTQQSPAVERRSRERRLQSVAQSLQANGFAVVRRLPARDVFLHAS